MTSSVRHHNVVAFFHYEVNIESLGLNSSLLKKTLLLANLKLFLLSHLLDCLIWPLHFH